MIVGERIHIRGTIAGNEDLVVRGRCEGSIRVGGTVTIESEAAVDADIEAQVVVVYGMVHGEVRASERIELTRSARMAGNACAPVVTIAAGASFMGRVEMGDTSRLALPPPAPETVERRALPREAAHPERNDEGPSRSGSAVSSPTSLSPLATDPEPMGSSLHPVVVPPATRRPVPPIARPSRGPLRRRSS